MEYSWYIFVTWLMVTVSSDRNITNNPGILPINLDQKFQTIIPSAKYVLKGESYLWPLTDICDKIQKEYFCKNELRTYVNISCQMEILFKNTFEKCLPIQLNRLQTLEFVPEINQYLGIFPVPVPIKTSCSNVLAQHQIQGVFLFENQLNCQKYVNDQLLIFNDTTEGKPIILEDFRLPARNNVKIPKLTLRTLQVTSLTNNLPRLQMYPYKDSKNIWHLTGTAILYFVFLALAIWFMMQKIAFRRGNQTEEAPEPVELPRDAKF
nr:PREDICTED: uncharacterized protein LOC107398742 [Tribolium castaneum]|eukprot:XP_015839413.1 PREDICTED: uncharacterized protein LOC107398742 [Tribolium castaneum]